MGLYEELVWVDLVEPIRPLLDRGELEWDSEKGKIVIPVKLRWNYPWVMGEVDGTRPCGLWLDFYFNIYKIFPKACQKCWKVVARPRTLKELFGVMRMQKGYRIPGKCGVENRAWTPGGVYGAYWYLPLGIGEEEAVGLKREIEADLAREVAIGMPMVVKRGCTEIEHYFGPSPGWTQELFDRMAPKEALLDALFEFNVGKYRQPGALVSHIQRQWVERAWREGDPTVWEFAERESFPSTPVDYDKGGRVDEG